MYRARIALLALLVAVPMTVSAAALTTLNLRQGQTNAKWEAIDGLQVSRQPNGLLLTATTQTGILVTDYVLNDIANPQTGYSGFPSMAYLVTDAPRPTSIKLSWHRVGQPTGEVSAMPVTIGAGQDIMTYALLDRYDEWQPTVDQVAILVPPGSTFLFKELSFVRWTLTERLSQMFLSFFSFDEYRMYAINFVWGPRLASSPIQRQSLWDTLPPGGSSATYMLNIALVLIIAGLFVMIFKRTDFSVDTKRHVWLQRSAMVLFSAWIALDLRMGSELLSWFSKDLKTYITAPEGTRVLREYDSFHEFAMMVSPLVSDRSSYVFFSQREYPDVPQMRYYTYPAVPSQDVQDDTWVIYDRDDIEVMNGRLVIEGQVVTGSGDILGEYDDRSFVFRVNPS